MSTKYLANRLKYHTASRVGAKETDPLLNALNKDQHTVHYSNVWTSPNNATKNDFPVNADNNAENSVGYNPNLPTDYNFKTNTDSTYATDNLIAIFKSGATSIDFKNGKIWTNTAYPAVKLYEAVDMTPVTGSNGSGIYYEAYEVLDENNIRLIDWVSPMAVSDPVINKPIPGYAGKLELNVKGTSNWVEVYKTDKSTASGVQGSVWDASYGNWEFVYSAGLAIFNADYTPTRYASYFSTYNNGTAVKDVVKLRWTGFLYTGTYSDKKQDIVDVNISGALTVQGIDVKKGIVNMFAGATLPDSTNLDSYYTTGISRITNNIQGTKPSISSVAGFLQVMDIDHDDDTTSMKDYRRLRQIIYPDNADESTPYTRVGELNSLTGTVSWSEWNQMGGGSLRRVVVDGTTSAKTINPAQNNVMYESFGSESSITDVTKRNKFTLPSASSVPVGTRIGIEQYAGMAHIYLSDDSSIDQVISASNSYSLTSDQTFQSTKIYYIFSDGDFIQATNVSGIIPPKTYYEKSIEPTSYVFECVLPKSGNAREWILDAEHNHGAILTEMNNRIADLAIDYSNMNKNLANQVDENQNLEESLHSRPMRCFTHQSSALYLEMDNLIVTKIQLTTNNISDYIGTTQVMSQTENGEYIKTYVTPNCIGCYIKQISNKNELIQNDMCLNYHDVHVYFSDSIRYVYLPSFCFKGTRVILELPYKTSDIDVIVVSSSPPLHETFITSNEGITDGQYLTLDFIFNGNTWVLLSIA